MFIILVLGFCALVARTSGGFRLTLMFVIVSVRSFERWVFSLFVPKKELLLNSCLKKSTDEIHQYRPAKVASV